MVFVQLNLIFSAYGWTSKAIRRMLFKQQQERAESQGLFGDYRVTFRQERVRHDLY